ncbi:MAG: response regulator [Alphaproteobacteria bacterium]|nr:MAG: response regulator [Alphaproteobacteria bacterium]
MGNTSAEGSRLELRRRYIRQLDERMRLLKPMAARLALETMSLADFEILEREAHRLSGSGAVYGYPAVSSTAGALELGLRNGVRDTTEIAALLAPLMKALLQVLTGGPQESEASFSWSEDNQRTEYRPLVLVADADPQCGAELAQMLKPFARVELVETGRAVLEASRRERFDLILASNAMPDVTGLELMAGLRPAEGQVASAVVMTITTRDAGLIPHLVAAGIRDYIMKPFELDVVTERIRTILQRQKPVVLIADDDPLICEIFRSKLRQRGVDVSVANSGAQALDMAKRLRPHAIILDRSMPRLDGMQVLSSIRNNALLSSTPVLILSARRKDSDIADGLALGADDYICKPFLPDNVVERCLTLLRSNGQLAA